MTVDDYPTRFVRETAVLPRIDPVTYFDKPTLQTISMLRDFERDGYFCVQDIFDDEEVSALLEEAERVRTQVSRMQPPEAVLEPQGQDLRTLFCVQQFSERFRELMRDQRILAIVGAILNDRAYLHQTRLSFEPAFRGQELYWHSDFETWHAEDGMPRMRAVTIAIFLTDSTAINGSLMLMPGSHKQFVSCPGEVRTEHSPWGRRAPRCNVPDESVVSELASFYGVSMPTGPAGTILALDCNLLKAANGNVSPLPRTSLFLTYNALSNRLQEPFCGRPRRAEFMGARSDLLMAI